MFCCRLGLQPYLPVEELQKELVALRQQNRIPDVLLLLEHEPVITLGRRADPTHILASSEALAGEGVQVCRTERGGDVTYHGPGQLVAYPILHLPTLGLGPSDYMHRLEDVAAALAADYGINTHRRDGIIGVWVGNNKLTALGVRIKGGICYHGLAFNVDPNMRHWSMIIPCGITDGGVTSLAAELGKTPPMREVEDRFTANFGALFSVRVVEGNLTAIRLMAESA
ncbi:MAG: lipoyl(octanoyl) transferase LipB [Chloroflexi bacterium]|nr:lipoyl(octanoyl) transferase LipB [Chloroflexota bacterium]